jgi:Raf kinase inhibitor-like YbhB/YbcL family protein
MRLVSPISLGLLAMAAVITPGLSAEGPARTLRLESSGFAHQGAIPARFTCEGDDVSPPLSWSAGPYGTRSFALIVDDPDAPDPQAPRRTWVHWVVYALPADTRGFEADAARDLPSGARHGKNDWGRAGYGGPCPPVGRHRYFHKLYALDVVLDSLVSPTKAELERAMEGHILARGELIGTYEKSGR